jgi:hypothetical protein
VHFPLWYSGTNTVPAHALQRAPRVEIDSHSRRPGRCGGCQHGGALGKSSFATENTRGVAKGAAGGAAFFRSDSEAPDPHSCRATQSAGAAGEACQGQGIETGSTDYFARETCADVELVEDAAALTGPGYGAVGGTR